jgi:hypothetical protein
LNFEHHIYSLVNHQDWNILNAMFWRLVKETDVRSAATFQQEFDDLVTAITKAATEKLGSSTHVKLTNALHWLRDTLYPKATRFAYRYTCGTFTGGAHSTQRSESIHADLKVMLLACFEFRVLMCNNQYVFVKQKLMSSSNYSLVQLFKTLFEMHEARTLTNAVKLAAPRKGLKPCRGIIMDRVRSLGLSRAVLERFEEQFRGKDCYKSTPQYDAEGVLIGWEVLLDEDEEISDAPDSSNTDGVHHDTCGDSRSKGSFVSSTGDCTCQFRACWGIACRHVLYVSTITQHRENGVSAVLGGAVDNYWIPNWTPPTTYSAEEVLYEDCNNEDDAVAMSTTSNDVMTQQQRSRQFHIMLGPLHEHVKRSQGNFNAFRDLFSEFTRRLGTSVGTEILNPCKPASKPGRKPRLRFANQHDRIIGIKSVQKATKPANADNVECLKKRKL